MTLQQIINHLVACVASMNHSHEYSLAVKAQGAIELIGALQDDCVAYGIDDENGRGDWQVEPPPPTVDTRDEHG